MNGNDPMAPRPTEPGARCSSCGRYFPVAQLSEDARWPGLRLCIKQCLPWMGMIEAVDPKATQSLATAYRSKEARRAHENAP